LAAAKPPEAPSGGFFSRQRRRLECYTLSACSWVAATNWHAGVESSSIIERITDFCLAPAPLPSLTRHFKSLGRQNMGGALPALREPAGTIGIPLARLRRHNHA
jgi:hypothetical protein